MIFNTVSDYCKSRGVTSQFVYEYIKKGKFKQIEAPIFVEYEGIMHAIGVKKVLVVPDEFAIKTYRSYEDFLNSLTNNELVKSYYLRLYAIKKPEERDEERQKFDQELAQLSKSEQIAFENAYNECENALLDYMKQLNGDISKLIEFS